jgi:N-methylhydantoinase B/oxoprolinase/acetone carboxylase alpha subunit
MHHGGEKPGGGGYGKPENKEPAEKAVGKVAATDNTQADPARWSLFLS